MFLSHGVLKSTERTLGRCFLFLIQQPSCPLAAKGVPPILSKKDLLPKGDSGLEEWDSLKSELYLEVLEVTAR